MQHATYRVMLKELTLGCVTYPPRVPRAKLPPTRIISWLRKIGHAKGNNQYRNFIVRGPHNRYFFNCSLISNLNARRHGQRQAPQPPRRARQFREDRLVVTQTNLVIQFPSLSEAAHHREKAINLDQGACHSAHRRFSIKLLQQYFLQTIKPLFKSIKSHVYNCMFGIK